LLLLVLHCAYNVYMCIIIYTYHTSHRERKQEDRAVSKEQL
jgi:hypothetical protein